jgi:hypothetical protein
MATFPFNPSMRVSEFAGDFEHQKATMRDLAEQGRRAVLPAKAANLAFEESLTGQLYLGAQPGIDPRRTS